MKKGFTLIEMLGIITVFAILLLIAFPNISGSLKQMKENQNNNFTNNLKISTETYIELNKEKYPQLNTTNGTVQVKIQELYDANLMKGDHDGLDKTKTITVTKQSNGTLKYYYDGNEIGIDN